MRQSFCGSISRKERQYERIQSPRHFQEGVKLQQFKTVTVQTSVVFRDSQIRNQREHV